MFAARCSPPFSLARALLAGSEADLQRAKAKTARRTLAECEQRLVRYGDALESGADAQVVARWTKDTEE